MVGGAMVGGVAGGAMVDMWWVGGAIVGGVEGGAVVDVLWVGGAMVGMWWVEPWWDTTSKFVIIVICRSRHTPGVYCYGSIVYKLMPVIRHCKPILLTP